MDVTMEAYTEEQRTRGSEDALANSPLSTFWRLVFQVDAPPPNVVGLDLRSASIVGHTGAHPEELPDLDLTLYGTSVNGVSRRHAVLVPDEDGVYLIDLSSTNGTWVNGWFLVPGNKHRLRPDDVIEFGHLKMVVRIIEQVIVTYDQGFDTTVTRPKPR